MELWVWKDHSIACPSSRIIESWCRRSRSDACLHFRLLVSGRFCRRAIPVKFHKVKKPLRYDFTDISTFSKEYVFKLRYKVVTRLYLDNSGAWALILLFPLLENFQKEMGSKSCCHYPLSYQAKSEPSAVPLPPFPTALDNFKKGSGSHVCFKEQPSLQWSLCLVTGQDSADLTWLCPGSSQPPAGSVSYHMWEEPRGWDPSHANNALSSLWPF